MYSFLDTTDIVTKHLYSNVDIDLKSLRRKPGVTAARKEKKKKKKLPETTQGRNLKKNQSPKGTLPVQFKASLSTLRQLSPQVQVVQQSQKYTEMLE